MVEIQVQYRGELRCAAEHGPSGQTLTTDAPVDNHGRGEAFSPTDLVGTALGTCMLTLMGIAARGRDWNLEGARARVTKSMAANPRRIARLEVEIEVPAALPEEARRVLEEAARSCPVHATLRPETEIPIRFRWGA